VRILAPYERGDPIHATKRPICAKKPDL